MGFELGDLLLCLLRFFLLLGRDPLLDDGDGSLQAGDGLIELGVVAEGHTKLVMRLCHTPGILGHCRLLKQTLLEVLNSLLVILALDANLAQGAHGTAEFLEHGELVLLLGLGELLGVDNLSELQHLPSQLQVGGLLLILLIVSLALFLFIRRLFSFIFSLTLLVLLHSFVLVFIFLALFGFLTINLLFLLRFLLGLFLGISLLGIVCGLSFLILCLGSLFGSRGLVCGVLLCLSLLFLLLKFFSILLQGFGDLLCDLSLLLVGELGWILELRGVGLRFLFRDAIKGVAKNTRFHPGQLEEGLTVVVIDLSAFLGSLAKLLGQEFTSLG